MWHLIGRFADDKSAASAMEYALVVALIALVIIAGVTFFGASLQNTFNYVSNSVSNVMP